MFLPLKYVRMINLKEADMMQIWLAAHLQIFLMAKDFMSYVSKKMRASIFINRQQFIFQECSS